MVIESSFRPRMMANMNAALHRVCAITPKRRTSRRSQACCERDCAVCKEWGDYDWRTDRGRRESALAESHKAAWAQMTSTAAKLLAQKRELLDRLAENPGPNEREEIERVLAKIDTALNWLDDAGSTDDP